MSGIVRAPALGVSFAIPYSGTPQNGDCILVVNAQGEVSIVASYFAGIWSPEYYIANFSDENNVISFKNNHISGDGRAAFIPGPEHF